MKSTMMRVDDEIVEGVRKCLDRKDARLGITAVSTPEEEMIDASGFPRAADVLSPRGLVEFALTQWLDYVSYYGDYPRIPHPATEDKPDWGEWSNRNHVLLTRMSDNGWMRDEDSRVLKRFSYRVKVKPRERDIPRDLTSEQRKAIAYEDPSNWKAILDKFDSRNELNGKDDRHDRS